MVKKRICLLLVLILTFSLSFSTAMAKKNDVQYGDIAYQHIFHLTNVIGARAAGSQGEADAAAYIYDTFRKLGYETTIQSFSYNRRGTDYYSANVIAVKPGKTDMQIIVGGHYDSVTAGKGVDDNASGIGVILEVAEILKDVNTPYTIKFIAFGAEEVGLKGSFEYASKMSEKEIKNTIVMINLDSLAVGDKMYAYGNDGKKGWFRDKALQIAKKLKLNMETNPGINPAYPAGTTGDWSDHKNFKDLGIPYLYFEATNWELAPYDGYTQTELDGEIWHTSKDTLEYIESAYPGRIREHLNTFVQVLAEFLKTCRNSPIE
ncbi:MAG TPA: M20/M25/M40 family metallo-hydrolase [Clostridiales bacterium]|nr:M20/M25/M40 family metallo-hydrolase [Clostridiales bacterium]